MAKERSVADTSVTKLATDIEAMLRVTGEERMKRERPGRD